MVPSSSAISASRVKRTATIASAAPPIWVMEPTPARATMTTSARTPRRSSPCGTARPNCSSARRATGAPSTCGRAGASWGSASSTGLSSPGAPRSASSSSFASSSAPPARRSGLSCPASRCGPRSRRLCHGSHTTTYRRASRRTVVLHTRPRPLSACSTAC